MPCKSWLTRRREAIWPSEIFVLREYNIQTKFKVPMKQETNLPKRSPAPNRRMQPNLHRKNQNSQSKDASQVCAERVQKANRRKLIEEHLYFSNFDSFLLTLVLENPNAFVQAWTLRIIVRETLKNERANFGVQHHIPRKRVLPQLKCEPWYGTRGEQTVASHANPYRWLSFFIWSFWYFCSLLRLHHSSLADREMNCDVESWTARTGRWL